MDISAMWSVRQDNPDRVNYDTRYSVAEGVRDYFAQDVIGSVHVGIQTYAGARPEQPALHPPAQISLRLPHWLPIEKAALRGVALLGHKHPNAHQLGFVAQQVDEASLWDKHEVLVASTPQCNVLFPAVVLSDHKRTNACT